MGVYIKEMEMPQSCSGCRFWTITSCIASYQGEKSCPLIEVPEPHGRLIDADEFLKRAIGTKCFHGDIALMLEELVGESTTIIPASEKEE